MGLLERAATWLPATLRASDGVTITLRRGASTTTGVTAVRGTTRIEIDEGDGVFTTVDVDDWLVAAADYRFGGVASDPQDGDQVELSAGGKTYVFEVLPIGGEACFRRSDPAGVQLRIHTKLKSVT